jgi:Ran GTPase-activating protein (RanGAP) involved in mRNA processing and transport
VWVVVDPDTKTVTRVVVGDEEFRWDDEVVSFDESGNDLTDEAATIAARAVADDDDAEWPSWDFGW